MFWKFSLFSQWQIERRRPNYSCWLRRTHSDSRESIARSSSHERAESQKSVREAEASEGCYRNQNSSQRCGEGIGWHAHAGSCQRRRGGGAHRRDAEDSRQYDLFHQTQRQRRLCSGFHTW